MYRQAVDSFGSYAGRTNNATGYRLRSASTRGAELSTAAPVITSHQSAAPSGSGSTVSRQPPVAASPTGSRVATATRAGERWNATTWLSSLTWRYTPHARLVTTQKVYSTGLRFDNRNDVDEVLDRARAVDAGWRSDNAFALRNDWWLEFGADAQRLSGRHLRQRTVGVPATRQGGPGRLGIVAEPL